MRVINPLESTYIGSIGYSGFGRHWEAPGASRAQVFEQLYPIAWVLASLGSLPVPQPPHATNESLQRCVLYNLIYVDVHTDVNLK